MNDALRVLSVGHAPKGLATSVFGPFAVARCESLEAATQRLAKDEFDALLVVAFDASVLASWPQLATTVLDTAVVLLDPADGAGASLQLLPLGVQDLLPATASGEMVARALRFAVERKRIERAARTAYATDLSTGLPNHAQLLEYTTQLLALREREPAPMALIALRVGGLGQGEAGNVLRRKAAVRLRSALRASDVVASIGNDMFAVLLAWIDNAGDGERVAAKLAQSLAVPFSVAGREQRLEVLAGLASYPEHGKDAGMLLRRAIAQAGAIASGGEKWFGPTADRGPDAAANDDEA